MSNVLGGLNHDALLSAEDYRVARDLAEAEVLDRFLLQSGQNLGSAETGIVDAVDPGLIASTETSRPLQARVSQLDSLKIDVTAGVAVTPNGALIASTGATAFSLARVLAGDVNVVFLENEIIPDGPNLLNDYNDPLRTREVQNPDSLRVALLADFNNVSLFPPTRKEGIVVVTVVRAVETASSAIELQVDLTRNTYSYNRPWYSVRDTRHRAKVGTGAATDQNPHGTSVNDLTTPGQVSLFQGFAETGMVVSRDRVINKMAGARRCVEAVPLTRIKTDTTGVVTARSPYNKVGARYVELLSFPTRLGAVYESARPGNPISAEVIEGTNLLVFGPGEVLTNPLTVEYTETTALLPPVSYPTNLVGLGQPQTDELILAGGLSFASVPDPSADLEGSGPYPRRYRLFCLGDATIAVFPQVVVPSVRLDVMGTSLYVPPRQPQFPGRLRIGFTKPNVVPSMAVSFTVFGKDPNGTAISETLSISTADGYADEAVPSVNYDAPAQAVVTENFYGQLDGIQIISRTDDGPLTQLQVWAEIEAGSAPEVNDAASIVELGWNGQGIAEARDVRLISKTFRKPISRPVRQVGEAVLDSIRVLSNLTTPALANQTSVHLMTEDFEELAGFDSLAGFWDAVAAIGTITISNNGFLSNNDTVLLKTGKTLTFLTGVADPTLGQAQIGGTAAITRTNMITAINDPTFDSGIVAAVGSGNNVDLTLLAPEGAAGNAIVLSATLVNALALTLSGYNFGYDRAGEAYLDRFTRGLWSDRIPADVDLNPSGYGYRRRYRSRPVALPQSQGAQVQFAVMLHESDRQHASSVRMRGSYGTNPNVWQPWQVLTALPYGNKGVYGATFAQPVHKVQVEIYGKATGVTILNVQPNP
jgi:hypothetical protein